MKKIIFLTLFVIIGCNLHKTQGLIEIPKKNSVIKNYAYCRCLNNIYPNFNNEFKDGSIATYEYQLESTEKIDSLIVLWLTKNKYNSIEDNNLGVMKCLDLYNSKALDSIVNSGQVNLIKIK